MSDGRIRVENELKQEKENLIELLPKKFQDEFREKSFIAGGAIHSLYNGNKPKDIDFFLTDEDFVKDLRSYFTDYIHVKNLEMAKKSYKVGIYRGKKLIVTDNAITIGKYQIITRWVGEPVEVVDEFDFLHNQFYIRKNEIETITQWEFLEDNVLRFNDNRARDIVGCIIRTKKFVKRGFKLSNKEMAKMLLKLNEKGFDERELEILHKTGEFDS